MRVNDPGIDQALVCCQLFETSSNIKGIEQLKVQPKHDSPITTAGLNEKCNHFYFILKKLGYQTDFFFFLPCN